MKVLLVDDEAIICQGMKTLLQQNYEFVEIVDDVRNGRRALEVMEQYTPDLVISDIRMPIMDGLSLMECISERYPHVDRVLITGHADFEYARRAIQFGVTDYLMKPISIESIHPLIVRLLSKKHVHWTRQADPDLVLELKELLTDLVKNVLAENKAAVIKRIDLWEHYCDTIPMSLKEKKEMADYILLAFRTEFISHQSDVWDSAAALLHTANSKAELFEKMKSYFLHLIQLISAKRAPRNKRVIDFVLQEIERRYVDPDVSIQYFADKAGVSPSYLSKMFREIMHVPFTPYLSDFRLEQAKRILESDDEVKLWHVSERCGFSDYSYFSKVFKKRYGIPPQEYREKQG
jgi:two-component system response regulator YesN